MSSPAPTGKLVLLMGPSGVGKSVILKRLRKAHPEFHFPRSATTRARREREGSDLYHFVTDAEFDRLLNDNKVLEWATVHAGARYGTLVEEIIPHIERGEIVIREVDVQGFESIRNHPLFVGSVPRYRLQSIFILPESKEQLIKHITKRAPMEQEELTRRLKSMEKELAYAELCDHAVKNMEGKMDATINAVEKLLKA
jgi:guanylate kinase